MGKNLKCILLFLGIALLCNSCFTDKQKNDDAIEININPLYSIYDTVSQKVNFIMLDDKNGAELFSSISKMIVINKRIYILDGNTSVIYIYNLNGDFLWKIDRIGQGPGEYIRLRDFNVQDNLLYVYDDIKRSLLCYDLNDRQHIKTISTPFFARAFALLMNGDFLFVLPKDQGHKSIIISDSLCNIKDEYIEYEKEDLDNRTRYSLLQETNLGITYSKPECNNIYLFSKKDGELLNIYTFLVDGDKYVKEIKQGPELCITPLLMEDGKMIGNYKNGANRYYFDVPLSQKENSDVKEFTDKRNRVTDLLYPVCAVGDSVIGSYILHEVYENFDNSVPLSDKMEEYLDNGGFLIGLYSIK